MNKYIIIFLIIVFLVVLLRNQYENFPYYFNTFDNYDRRYCKNCNSKSILDCGNCYNCGICIKDNISTCESGDIDGPDTKQCDKWIYNSDQIIVNSYNQYYNQYYNRYYNPYNNPYYNRYNNPYYNPYYYNRNYYGYNDYPYYRTKLNRSRSNKNRSNKNKSNKTINKVVRSSKYNLDVFGRGKK